MTNVSELKRAVDRAWDDADRAVTREMDVIIAAHAPSGLIRSGGTIKKAVRAAEPIAERAVDEGRKALGGSKSVILRLKLAEFQAARVHAFSGLIEARLSSVGLAERAGRDLIAEAMARATRPAPMKLTPSRTARVASWTKKAAAYVGHNLIMVLLTGILLAVILTWLKLD